MNLTFDQAVKEHRKMWRAIAKMEYGSGKSITDYKWEYFKYWLNGPVPKNMCFCCEYGSNALLKKIGPRGHNSIRICIFCPLKWVNKIIPSAVYYPLCTNNFASPYFKLKNCIRYNVGADEFKCLCLEIAELPANDVEPENIFKEE